MQGATDYREDGTRIKSPSGDFFFPLGEHCPHRPPKADKTCAANRPARLRDVPVSL